VESNLEALIIRLDNHIRESDRRHEETAEILKDYKIMINSKVSKEQFMWVIGILIMILMAMFGYIALRLDNLSSSATQTQTDVSFLKGKLAPYDVQYKN
jgi:hypothetical protein